MLRKTGLIWVSRDVPGVSVHLFWSALFSGVLTVIEQQLPVILLYFKEKINNKPFIWDSLARSWTSHNKSPPLVLIWPLLELTCWWYLKHYINLYQWTSYRQEDLQMWGNLFWHPPPVKEGGMSTGTWINLGLNVFRISWVGVRTKEARTNTVHEWQLTQVGAWESPHLRHFLLKRCENFSLFLTQALSWKLFFPLQ